MQLSELIVSIVAISTFGGVLRTYIQYKQKALEARIDRHSSPDATVASELSAVKKQITELRDVTTQYDMSFDSALHRVESRLSTVEQRIHSLEQISPTAQVTR